MALIKWAKGIEFVSGLLSKRPKAGTPHSDHSNALLATHRVAETTNPSCTRIYMVGEYNRNTPVTQNELVARERFTQVSRLVKARAKNLQTITTDQADYAAQKDLPNGKKTWKAYLWYICGSEYDQAHPQG